MTQEAAGFDTQKMRSKITALLAKAERTTNEHERDAYLAMAEKMMLRLGIERAELEAHGKVTTEEIIEVTRTWTGRYSIVMVPFVSNVATGFGDLTVLQSIASPTVRRTYIIGHRSDVEQFLTLIDSLALQVHSALRRWQQEHVTERRRLTDMQRQVQNRSFIIGFGQTVRRRLTEERTEATQSVSTGAALVLASKAARISSWVESAYPRRGKSRGMRSLYRDALDDGRAAGRSASLTSKGELPRQESHA